MMRHVNKLSEREQSGIVSVICALIFLYFKYHILKIVPDYSLIFSEDIILLRKLTFFRYRKKST